MIFKSPGVSQQAHRFAGTLQRGCLRWLADDNELCSHFSNVLNRAISACTTVIVMWPVLLLRMSRTVPDLPLCVLPTAHCQISPAQRP